MTVVPIDSIISLRRFNARQLSFIFNKNVPDVPAQARSLLAQAPEAGPHKIRLRCPFQYRSRSGVL
jgi:hypothetical protein